MYCVRVNIVDFGARGDGKHDDFAAFQAALDSGAQEIVIPQGIYAISETLKVQSNTSILADHGAKIVMKSTRRRVRNEFLLSNADPENGNKNIKISGGIWDGNNTAPENAKPDLFDKNGYSGTTLNFVNVDSLELSNMILANSVTFYVRLCKVHHFVIENIDFVCDAFGANQDGLHFGGDVKHGRVKNIRALSYGQTNDDMIALNADDSIERVENLDLVRDAIEDITFENIFTENCHAIIRMLSVTAAIKNIRFKNIYAGFRGCAINADAARYCRTPLFKEEEYPDGVGQISDIYFENFVCFPVFDLPENFGGSNLKPEMALIMETHMDNFRISGFKYLCPEDRLKDFPVLRARNLVHGKITADGREYLLKNKDKVLVLDTFCDLRFDRV